MNFRKRLEQWKNTAQQKIEKFTTNLTEPTNLVTQIRPGLCHIPFPQPHLIQPLSEFINNKFGANYFIWNLAEQTYDSQPFLNQISHTSILNYPILPLANLLLLTVNIKQWLKQKGNVALVHCGKNKGRSALLLAVYLYLDGWHDFLEDSLVQVNKLLSINKNETLFPSQHIFIRNCINLFSGFSINNKPLRLIRIIMNKIPQLIDSDGEQNKFTPVATVYQLNTNLGTFSQSQISADSISISLDIQVLDDILIWIKHKKGDDLYSCFRIILNTNFVTDNFLRINQNELDLTRNVKPCKGFFIDFMFQSTQSSSRSRLSQVGQEVQKAFKLKQEKKHIRKIEQQLVEEKLKQITEVSSEQPRDNSFSIDENTSQMQTTQRGVPKMVEKLVMQVINSEQQPEDIDDYIKQLQESIDMSMS